MAEPTYIFRDGNVYEMVDGKVVSSAKEADFSWADMARSESEPPAHPIDGEVEMPAPPEEIAPEPCPSCGQPTEPQDSFCPNCGSQLQAGLEDSYQGLDGHLDQIPGDEEMARGGIVAQTVTTPNGLKGKVLARVPALWGEEVTVRFENGVIRKIPVDGMTFSSAEESNDKATLEQLEERLGSSTLNDRDSLTARVEELHAIKREAASLVSQSSDTEAATLDRISVEADYEIDEIQSALDHLDSEDVEAFEAPAPIESVPVVEQASLGGSQANWLDRTVAEMQAEASSTDYEQLMDEGPEAFVASLEDDQLADAKTVRIMAASEIRTHTAGAEEDIRDKYEKVWLSRCEEERRARLAARKEEVRKEASSEEFVNAPDESLFM